eukprot:6575719-Pyramimonas_sp.AAC.1
MITPSGTTAVSVLTTRTFGLHTVSGSSDGNPARRASLHCPLSSSGHSTIGPVHRRPSIGATPAP